MIAAVIPRFGPPDVLEVREYPTPTPMAREVLVRVHASALNRADLLQRIGRYPAPPGWPGDVPGLEFAGEVAATGSDAVRWRTGDRVFGLVGGGAHAEYVVVHESTLVRIPDAMTWHQAAAIPEAFFTAHDAMITQGALRPGERVLVHAVASGVGLAAVQIARAWGAHPYGTSRTATKLPAAVAAGMIDGVALPDSLDPLAAAIARWTDGHGMDLTIDLVGGAYLPASIAGASLHGRLILVGAVAGARAEVDVRQILSKRLTLRGTVMRARTLEERIIVASAFESDILPRLATGALVPNIDSVFALAAIVDAHTRLETNETVGKVIIEMPPR
ncbi:MAG: NAD(P)H-quinone oxidoreductase [Gemmatimonadetes bacterium]|nr:NAD(P)H-quinone oxidoreductase [Gemmatimonadota bacterium]